MDEYWLWKLYSTTRMDINLAQGQNKMLGERYAFLIMAHNEFAVLERLVSLLDHERNDIFIHFDKKIHTIPEICTSKSKSYILEQRIDNRWGSERQIDTELLLFREAVKHGPYGHYHLLSGVDLPIKSMREIHDFFDQNPDKEFVDFITDCSNFEFRVKRYHFFINQIKSSIKFISLGAKVFGRFNVYIQKLFHISRNNDLQITIGSQWISITDSFVKYLLNRQDEIKSRFHHSKCSDEVFVQTILWNSPFCNNIYRNSQGETDNLREIKWSGGGNSPIIYQEKDFNHLVNSGKLFARKFSETQWQVIERISQWIRS